MRFGIMAAAALMCAAPASAALTFEATETVSGVTFTNTGSINLAGLTFQYVGNGGGFIAPNIALISPSGSGDVYAGLVGSTSFGSGGTAFMTSQSGNLVGISGGPGLIILPLGYTSGAALSSSFTFAGATFASLGISQGEHIYGFGSGANADTVTVRIGPAVPEPATWAMMIMGVGLVGGSIRRRSIGRSASA